MLPASVSFVARQTLIQCHRLNIAAIIPEINQTRVHFQDIAVKVTQLNGVIYTVIAQESEFCYQRNFYAPLFYRATAIIWVIVYTAMCL